MCECPECEEKMDEDDVQYDCPFCGKTDLGEGFYVCENCGTLFDYEGDLWECEFCENEGESEDEEITFDEEDPEEEVEYCPECGEALEDPECCWSCGWPDENQGWIGEQ